MLHRLRLVLLPLALGGSAHDAPERHLHVHHSGRSSLRSATGGAVATTAPTAPTTPPTAAPTSQLQQQANQQFDMYVLLLSWQPGLCHEHSSLPACSTNNTNFFGSESLTVRGLWPSITGLVFPTFCAQQSLSMKGSTRVAVNMIGRENLAMMWPDPSRTVRHWRSSVQMWRHAW